MAKPTTRRTTLAMLAAALFLVAPASSSCAATSRRGPEVGSEIPHSLAALDQNGRRQDFQSLKGKRGLLLLFSRSLDW